MSAIFLCLVLLIGICSIMFSYIPWTQAHMPWMTTYKFFIVVGLLVGCVVITYIYYFIVWIERNLGG